MKIVKVIKKMNEDTLENGAGTINLEDVQKADSSEYSDITIDNAHKQL